jgi:hypothetical protein
MALGPVHHLLVFVGSSRLLLSNLDHLSRQCKPGHRPIAGAVFECFSSSRVVVHKCRILVLPGKPNSRSGLDCQVMHAQGMLTGEAFELKLASLWSGALSAHLVCQQQ